MFNIFRNKKIIKWNNLHLLPITYIENKIIRHLVKSIYLSYFQLKLKQLYDIFNWISTILVQRL